MSMLRGGRYLNNAPFVIPRWKAIVRTMASLFPMEKTGAPKSATVTSPWFTIGAAEAGTISIVNGQYQITGSAWTDSSGVVSEGDVVRVRVTSSVAYSTTVSLTLTCNSLDFVFDITTVDGDGLLMMVGGRYVMVGGKYVRIGGS